MTRMIRERRESYTLGGFLDDRSQEAAGEAYTSKGFLDDRIQEAPGRSTRIISGQPNHDLIVETP